MRGAVFYSSRYGSTAQYAQWIAEATSLPVYDLDKTKATLAEFDFLVLGSPVIYHKVMFHRWVKRNLKDMLGRPTVFFSVSGAGAGPKLDSWMADSLPPAFLSHVAHVALRGRQDPGELTRYDRIMLIIGGLKNPDRQAAKEEIHGFDFMDKNSIRPIVERIRELQA
ncbi:flavodoxin domain-containing protein [Candidatus Bipolaricaulota bacterium]